MWHREVQIFLLAQQMQAQVDKMERSLLFHPVYQQPLLPLLPAPPVTFFFQQEALVLALAIILFSQMQIIIHLGWRSMEALALIRMQPMTWAPLPNNIGICTLLVKQH